MVCAWLSRAQVSSIEIQLLLRPICDEGRIPQLPTLDELTKAGEASGLPWSSTLRMVPKRSA